MGVINVTPDSFSDGGRFAGVEAAVAHGHALVAAGADLLDVGGESTRPGAARVSADEEMARVVPVITRLARELVVPVSVDTVKAEVARAAVEAGALLVNDVSGGLADPAMGAAIDALGVTYVVGFLPVVTSLAQVHAEARPPPRWTEVADGLAARLRVLGPAARARAWVDPGLGFAPGADPAANLALLRHAGDLGRAVGCPVVVGPSRKRFLRVLLERAGPIAAPGGRGPIDEAALDAATVGACLLASGAGAAVLRVHNVALLHAALTVYTGG
ncbi:MAG: dihydropteroate synthase [Kofleriaceae bacterium]|nr:dihydropteroate synthase [Kofleriaceae bacterium]MBP6839814.1 dihydropteroate synthase [Kofleriaceae bacterium]